MEKNVTLLLLLLLCWGCSGEPFGKPKVQFAKQGQIAESTLIIDGGEGVLGETRGSDYLTQDTLHDAADWRLDGGDLESDGQASDLAVDGADLGELLEQVDQFDGEICQSQCEEAECGPDMCGGSCGNCPNSAPVCVFGQCKKCKPDCSEKECGPDGCGGACGTCPSMFTCLGGFCKAPFCEGVETVFFENFDSCSQGAFEVLDMNTEDNVTWWGLPSPEDTDDCHLYLGDPVSMSYYTGFSVEVGLVSTQVTIPSGAAWKLTFDLRADAEPVPLPQYPYDYDVLFLSVLDETDGQKLPLFSTKELLNNTAGEYVLVSLELSELAGKTVRFVFNFDTIDSTANDFAGFWLDNFLVDSICPYCKGGDCHDEDPCTTDECSLFFNEDQVGHCIASPQEGCCLNDPESFCDDDNECTEDACIADTGLCVHAPVPDCAPPP